MSRDREMAFTDRMSDHEAMMWNVEKDPWLNPNGAGLIVLDRPPDHDHFRQTIRAAVARIPRLYERVVPGLARLSTPAWAPDPEFDLDYHVRYLNLPSPGTERQLFDLAAHLYQEPLDRTRPLWRFVVIEGIDGGRAAIWALTHHSVADGIGQMRMAEMYQQLSPDDPPPDDVDLDAVVAAAVEAHDAKESGGNLATDFADTTAKSVSHLVRRQAGLARRTAAEMAMWGSDPTRARDTIGDVLSKVSVAAGIVRGDGEVESGCGCPSTISSAPPRTAARRSTTRSSPAWSRARFATTVSAASPSMRSTRASSSAPARTARSAATPSHPFRCSCPAPRWHPPTGSSRSAPTWPNCASRPRAAEV
jgi:hypothetical protein